MDEKKEKDSSYNKICRHLMELREPQEFLKTVVDPFEHFRVKKVDFSLQSAFVQNERKFIVHHTTTFQFENKKTVASNMWRDFADSDLKSLIAELSSSFAEDFVTPIWKKKRICPSYGCRLDKAQDALRDWFMAHLSQTQKDQLVQIAKDLTIAEKEYQETEQYKQGLLDFEEKQIRAQIISTMEQFSSVPEHVVRQAFDEYLSSKIVDL